MKTPPVSAHVVDFESICRKNHHFLDSRARRVPYEKYGLELDDMLQAGRIGLWRAALRYDPLRGVPIATYARPFVDKEMRRAMHSATPILLLDDLIPADGAEHRGSPVLRVDPTDSIIDSIDLKNALLLLKPNEQYVAMAIDGFNFTQSEVAAVLGVTQQYVAKSRKSVLRKLRALLDVA